MSYNITNIANITVLKTMRDPLDYLKDAQIHATYRYSTHSFIDEDLLPKAIDFFYKHINKTDFCWIWTGCKNAYGYGMMYCGVSIRSHRFSFLIHNGKLKKGMYICHKCNNPTCVNPEHLYQGNAKTNANDRSELCRIRNQRQNDISKMATISDGPLAYLGLEYTTQ